MLDKTVLILLVFTSAATAMAVFRADVDDYPHISNPLTSPEKYPLGQQRLTSGLDQTGQEPLDMDTLLEYDGNADEVIDRSIHRSTRLVPPNYGKFIGRRSQLNSADTGSSDQSPSGELTSFSCIGDGNDDVNGKPGCENAVKLVRDARASSGGHQLRSFVKIGRRSMYPKDHVTRDITEEDIDHPSDRRSHSDRNRKQPSLRNVVRRAAHSSFVRIGKSELPYGNPIKEDDPENVEEAVNGLTVVQYDNHQPASADHSVPCIDDEDEDESPLGASLTRLRCHLTKIASALDGQRPEAARQQINHGVDETIDGETPQPNVPAKRYSSFVRIGRAARDVSRVQRDICHLLMYRKRPGTERRR